MYSRIIIAGDDDFLPPIRAINWGLERRVELWAFKDAIGSLRNAKALVEVTYIDDIIDQIKK